MAVPVRPRLAVPTIMYYSLNQSIMRKFYLPFLFFLIACACPSLAQTVALISDATELEAVATQCAMDGCAGIVYELQADIDLSTSTWTSIGTSTQPFVGSFNGKGHMIKGFGTLTPSESAAGLFGYIGAGGRVDSLGVSGKAFAKNLNMVGVIAGCCDGEINQCWSMAQLVVVNCEKAGGLVGELQPAGKIIDCYNSGYITSNVQRQIGGIAGLNAGNLTRVYNIGYAKNGCALVGGEKSATATYVNCCFDRKLYDQTAGTSKEGVTPYDDTKEMFGIFADQPAIWVQSTTAYPILKAFASSNAAKVSVAPMYIDADCLNPVNHANDITENFTVGTEGGISWACQADSAKRWFQFNGSNVTVRRPCTERDALVNVTKGSDTRVVYLHPRKLEDLDPGIFQGNSDQEYFCYDQEVNLIEYIQVDTASKGWIYDDYHFMVTRDSVTQAGDTVRMDTIEADLLRNKGFDEWLNEYKVDTKTVGTFVLRRWVHDEGCTTDWIASRKNKDSKEKGRMVYTVYPQFQNGEIQDGLDTLILTTASVTVNVLNVREASGGGGAISYQWLVNGEEIAGRTEKDLGSYVISAPNTYTFRRTEKDEADCYDTNNPYSDGTKTFVILEKFDPGEVTNQGQLTYCKPDDVPSDLVIEGSLPTGGTGNYRYQWYTATTTDTTAISGATEQNLDLSSFTFAAGNDYTFVRKAEDNSSFTTLTRSREEQQIHIMKAVNAGIIQGGALDSYCAPYDAAENTSVTVTVPEVTAASGEAALEYRWIRVEDGQVVGTEATLNATFPLSELLGNTFTYKREVRNAGGDCDWVASTGAATQYYGQDKRTEVVKTICKEKLPYTLARGSESHTFTADNESWLFHTEASSGCADDTLFIIHTVTMPVFNIDTVAHACQTTGVITLYYEKTSGQSDQYRITYSDAMASIMGRKTDVGTIDQEGVITITNVPAIGSGSNYYLELEIGYAGEASSAEDICFSDPTHLRLDFSLGGYLHTKYDRVLFVDNNPTNGIETGGEEKLKFVSYQ